jgi:hypothetical protein
VFATFARSSPNGWIVPLQARNAKGRLAVKFPVLNAGYILAVAALFVLAGMQPAHAGATLHPAVVLENPIDTTPQLVATTSVSQPHVDAIGQLGSVVYAGGLFDRIRAAGLADQKSGNFMAFDASSGKLRARTVSTYKDPVFDGQIWAIATYGNSVFVGGQFTKVNGISRRNLVKLNASTGAVDRTFNANFTGGIVWDLQVWGGPSGSNPMLVAAGSIQKKLLGLNLKTGADNQYFNLGISDPLPNAWGGVSIYSIAVSPNGSRLVAVGNFQTVQGHSRSRLFVANITGSKASLASWYYPGFAKHCASTSPRRIAYLQSVDFSPDSKYFVVTATGQIPASNADIWPTGLSQYHTVCDAAGRFNMSDDQKPVWINYTGGDSVWRAVATGAAVYVQGHFKWLDNPYGYAGNNGGGAVQRLGIGAINPVSGKALPWNPPKPAQIGGKAFLATSSGLWVGSDSLKFNNENHRGIAFVPLP